MTLPGVPEPPPRIRKAVPPGVRATRVKQGRLCERCCRLIHEHGQAVAPYPRGARWRVTTPDGVERLCDAHKDERLGNGP